MNLTHQPMTTQQLVGLLLGLVGIVAGTVIFFGAHYVLNTQFGGVVHFTDMKLFGILSAGLTLGILAIAATVYNKGW